jgi:hypothetical protein
VAIVETTDAPDRKPRRFGITCLAGGALEMLKRTFAAKLFTKFDNVKSLRIAVISLNLGKSCTDSQRWRCCEIW